MNSSMFCDCADDEQMKERKETTEIEVDEEEKVC